MKQRDGELRFLLQLGFWCPLALCTWLALVPSPPDAIGGISDVILHAFAFSYLSLFLRLAYPTFPALATVSVLVAYGAAIEILQGLGGQRTAEWADLGVDLIGIAIGSLLALLLGARINQLLAGIYGWLRRG